MGNEINAQIQTIALNSGEDLMPSWTRITDIVLNSIQNRLGYKTRNKRQKLMTDEILLLMDERRSEQIDRNRRQHVQRHSITYKIKDKGCKVRMAQM